MKRIFIFMRVYCTECGNKTKIISSRQNYIFCQCGNINCGHTFACEFFPKTGESNCSIIDRKIFCKCKGRAKVIKNNRISEKVSDLYCRCEECNYKFVVVRSFAYSISLSVLHHNTLMSNIVSL